MPAESTRGFEKKAREVLANAGLALEELPGLKLQQPQYPHRQKQQPATAPDGGSSSSSSSSEQRILADLHSDAGAVPRKDAGSSSSSSSSFLTYRHLPLVPMSSACVECTVVCVTIWCCQNFCLYGLMPVDEFVAI